MGTQILQVRDVPTEDVEVLRARAADRKMSLSRYLRELIHDDARRPVLPEVLERIASREPIAASSDDIRSFIEEGRH